MAAVETYPERYANPADFAREVNLPLLGSAALRPVPAGAGLAQLLDISSGAGALGPVVDRLTETRRSLTLRSLLVAGFPHDPECFATALCLAREWSRRGLRAAVVDLDFWNPTVSRPPSHPNEGLVDVLEYGCSFGRVAWEIVADKLWLIGPGSHPPEESRIAEHPDWARAARVFGSCVDVVIYSAPLLDRRGFTGKLSKKMDAVLLTAATERIGRADLRDAFLELWASDAPMIGCVGIESADASAAVRRTEPLAGAALSAPPMAELPSGALAPVEATPAWEREAAAAVYAAEVAHAAAPSAVAEPARTSRPGQGPRGRVDRAEDPGAEREVEAALERDVRRGIVEKKPAARRGNLGILVGAVLGLALVAGGLSALLSKRAAPPQGSVQANQPAGEEPVTPASSTEERGNLDDPNATAATPGTGPAGEMGSVTAMGKEMRGTDSPSAPGAASPASESVSPASPPAPSSRTPSNEALRAGLGGAGGGSLPNLAPVGAATNAAKPFSVHVASFRTETKVKEIVQALRAKKLDARFEPPPPGGDWYRVFVGRFATESEAQTYAQWLIRSGAVDRAQSYPQTKR